MSSRGYSGGGISSQLPVPVTPAVKTLLIANVSIYVVLQLILDGLILDSAPVRSALMGGPFEFLVRDSFVAHYLALTPSRFLQSFSVWQVVTYMFLHAANVFHILFNMLMLWWLGAELELRWGSRFFYAYYFASGIGAGLIYCFGLLFAALIFPTSEYALMAPVMGASGAVFGLLLAYGLIFGERIVLFFGLIPMRAKYMVAILGAMEAVSLLNNGGSSSVANLAHLGGIASGYLFLQIYTRFKQSRWRRQGGSRGGRGLRLVVNNDVKKNEKDGPRYWN